MLWDAQSGAARVLVASDALTRGMDVAGVGAVVNYDAPAFAKTYVHRAGRTARARQHGEALVVCGLILLSGYAADTCCRSAWQAMSRRLSVQGFQGLWFRVGLYSVIMCPRLSDLRRTAVEACACRTSTNSVGCFGACRPLHSVTAQADRVASCCARRTCRIDGLLRK